MADAKHVFQRAIVCKDVSIDLIIGLPSIQYFDLIPILQSHLKSIRCCEICSVLRTVHQNISPVAVLFTNDDRQQLSSDRHSYKPKSGNLQSITQGHNMESVMLPGHHSNYSKEMQGLFYNISSAADTTYLPT
jgi:hypothetical protein